MLLVAGVVVLLRTSDTINRTNVVAYFENSNGIYVGDDVRILGVNVGQIDKIEPQPDRVKISFWYDDKYKVPADAKAAVLSPTLVTSRAIQLTPVYTGGPTMADDAVIPRERTAVPVEWDALRQQLERLAKELQPTEPGGVSPLGSVINTAADNLRGQGANIRDTVIKLSQAFSALGDHSTDIFSTVKNLSILVSALQDSTDSDAAAQPEPGVGDRSARRRSRRGRQRGQRPQRRGRRRPDASSPTTANRWAPRRTSWQG